jgi:hypothetical protein
MATALPLGKLVSVGSDGRLAVTALDDGVSVSADTSPEASWKVTSNENPCHAVAVYDKASVAFSGSENEACGYFWDLMSRERLLTVDGGTFRHKFDFMPTSFSASGTLAYMKRIACDDNGLNILLPLMPPA